MWSGIREFEVVNGTPNTSTFSNIQITGGNGGAPVVTPAAVLASRGENVVPLHWLPSFRGASYTVKRATTSGGPYSATVISGVAASSHTDTTTTKGKSCRVSRFQGRWFSRRPALCNCLPA
jgi:hypothetical protein